MSRSITPWVRFNGPNKPKYQTEFSAGCDLVSTENVSIPPGRSSLVGTGLILEIPEDFVGMVCPRSGLALKHGITVLNAPGIIDCFSEDSVISTLDGRKSVHDLKINHAVFSFNEETHEIQKDIVTAIVDVGIKDVINFTLEDNSVLSITPGTLVYTNNGLKAAEDLTFDDQVLIDQDI